MLSSEEATALLTGMDVSTVVGLRDRAIIAVMIYTFARFGSGSVMPTMERYELVRNPNSADQPTIQLSFCGSDCKNRWALGPVQLPSSVRSMFLI